jgi:hypothetical protein
MYKLDQLLSPNTTFQTTIVGDNHIKLYGAIYNFKIEARVLATKDSYALD